MSDSSSPAQRSGLEPELGGIFRDAPDRTGFEPELGGEWRQKGIYVDEVTCIGCKHCAHVAPSTFFIEPDQGRSRVINQEGDPEDLVQEAIDTCPVDCIHWVETNELQDLEEERKTQVIKPLGFPQSHGSREARKKAINEIAAKVRAKREQNRQQKKRKSFG